MSAKHRALLSGIDRQSQQARLAKGKVKEGVVVGDDSDQETVSPAETHPQLYAALVQDRSDSDEESDDSDDVEGKVNEGRGDGSVITQEPVRSHRNNRKQNQRKSVAEDEGILDLLTQSYHGGAADDSFLHVNPNGLDLDSIFRRKLGRHVERGGSRPQQPQRKSRRNQVFGASKEEWPKPVNYVGGGVKMIEETTPPEWSDQLPYLRWFRFQHSADYARRQREFMVLQNTGDMNLLLLFLSVHPSHLDSLLHMADLFARLGEMERAADLVRRCLYYHEASYASTFLPCRGAFHPPCCLSFLREENQSFFRALFLHFQLAWMKGFLSVATDLLKVLLSLEPLTDPMHTLLLLDKLLLMGARFEEIDHFCQQPASRALALPAIASAETTAAESRQRLLLLSEIFPNWAYSLALAHRLKETKAALAAPRRSDELLISALRRFPFLVWQLLEGVQLFGSDQHLWASLQEHKFFRHFSVLDRFLPPSPPLLSVHPPPQAPSISRR
jgi:hypothetical protein